MSLINQALRKAQRDRTPNRMSQPDEQSPAAYASSAASSMNPALVIGLVITVAILIGLVVGLSAVLFKGDSAPPGQVATAPAAAAQTAATTATDATNAPSPAETVSTIARLSAFPAATAAVETTSAPSVVDELRKAREASEAEAAAQAKAAAERTQAAEQAAARAAAKPSEDIIAWLSSARLSGVRISDTGSRAIINGETYAVGEFVNFQLGLKVMVVQEERVLFVDKNGKKYMKRL